jgi:hypothetical protein
VIGLVWLEMEGEGASEDFAIRYPCESGWLGFALYERVGTG